MTDKAATKMLTRADYYALHGLLVLAKQHFDAMESIEHAIMAMLGEGEEGGHASDVVWSPGSRTVDELVALYGFDVVAA